MITLQDLRKMQEALDSVLFKGQYIGKALSALFRSQRSLVQERAWMRDVLYRFVQLKNRYRRVVEMFSAEAGGKADSSTDIRLWLICRHTELKSPSSIDAQAFDLLSGKSRGRKLLQFLQHRPVSALFQRQKKADPAYLWEYHSHPLWMIRKWLGVYKYSEVVGLCEYDNTPPEVSLRVNPQKTTRADLVASLQQEGYRCEEVPISPFGVVVDGRMDPLTHHGYKAGLFTMQSRSSQLVSLYVNPKPGMRVLDYCAGEGGKSLLMSHLMKGKGEILAHDREMWRLRSLQERARKEGVDNIRIEGSVAVRRAGATFDTVVVDAPCSGSGNLRNQPEVKWRITSGDLDRFNLLQNRILDEVSGFCAAGGYLFYVTCSLFNEENHKVVRRFLGSRKGWDLVSPNTWLELSHSKGFWAPAEAFQPFVDGRYFQILPHRHRMSAMFCAVLHRKGE